MAYNPVDLVVVSAWGKTVGALAQDPRTGFFAFEYDPSWIRTRIELSPFHVRNSPGVFVFPQLSEPTYRRLPAMLADALPDQFGTSLLEAYLAGLGVASHQITSLDRLAYMGRRGMGALEFAPPIGRNESSGTAFDLAQIVAQGRNAIAGSFGTEADATAGVRELIQIGSSAGGLRAKAIIAWNADTGEVRGGHVAPDPGFEPWIIKLDGVEAASEVGATIGHGRVEYAYFLMASAAGVAMSRSRLLEEGGRAHFMTHRFDRAGTGKIHTQTLCAR